jgi:hypothetical protein
LVLTPAATSIGGELPSDLAVELDYDATTVRVTHAGRVVGDALTVGLGEGVRVELFLWPGLDERENAAMLARVDAIRGGVGVRTTLLDGFPFLAQRDLEDRLSGCDRTPGLFMAIEGRGDMVEVGTLRGTTQECVNPSHFAVPYDDSVTLSRTHLGTGSWTEGGVGEPSLHSSSPGAGRVQWDLFFDATNYGRDLERFGVRFAIGHVRTEVWDNSPWSGWDGPRAGDNPPECLDISCSDHLSYREPFVLGAGGRPHVVFARQMEAGNKDVFGIRGQWTASWDLATPLAEESILAPTDLDGSCRSLRDPCLAPRSEGDDGYWLFFTCERDGASSRIDLVGLDSAYVVEADSHTPVLDSSLGAFAQGGVEAPEIITEFNPVDDQAIYRMWFVAKDVSQARTVAMAQAQVSALAEVPRFAPYPANPVLRADDRVMTGCVSGDCPIESLAVARHALDRALRFLVARRVQLSGDVVEYQLVPLSQFWRSPWPDM